VLLATGRSIKVIFAVCTLIVIGALVQRVVRLDQYRRMQASRLRIESPTRNANMNHTVESQLMQLDPSGKYLVSGKTGNAVFITGDAPQTLMVEVSSEDVEIYLADRASRGFNALWVLLVDSADQSNAPRNFYRDEPFQGPDFTNENEPYWEHVDYVLHRASHYGITLVLNPGFVGLHAPEGFLQSYLRSSPEVMFAYGYWLGSRYRGYDNIIWSLGGDADTSYPGLYSKLCDLAKGIASADRAHLITLEASRFKNCAVDCVPVESGGSSSLDGETTPPSWLKLNWVYQTYSTVQAGCASNYSRTGSLPSLMGEDWYEGEHSLTARQVREEGYRAVLSGCYLGRLFGNNAIWTMGGPRNTMRQTWQSQLGSEGSVSQAWLGKLMRSREHWKMAPDLDHAVLVSGFDSGPTSAPASRAIDGRTVIAYIPSGAPIGVDMSKIVSSNHSAHGWWFNPVSGVTIDLGLSPTTGLKIFAPPDIRDWVLVLDDAEAAFLAPGSRDIEGGLIR